VGTTVIGGAEAARDSPERARTAPPAPSIEPSNSAAATRRGLREELSNDMTCSFAKKLKIGAVGVRLTVI